MLFSHEASSTSKAMLSAVTDVKNAFPQARLIEANPDLVGLSDIAGLLDITKVSMQLNIARELRALDPVITEKLHKAIF